MEGIVAAGPLETQLFISSPDFASSSGDSNSADTVKRDRRAARTRAQTDEVAVMWPFESAKFGPERLRKKIL